MPTPGSTEENPNTQESRRIKKDGKITVLPPATSGNIWNGSVKKTVFDRV